MLAPLASLVRQEVDLDHFLDDLVDQIARAMQADRGTLYLLDPPRGELFSRAAHLPEIQQIRLKIGQGVAGKVAQTGELWNVPNENAGQHVFGDVDRITGYTTRSLLAAPLKDRSGALFGVLQVLNRRGADRFSPEDVARFEQICTQLAQGLEGTSLYAELRRAKEQPEAPIGYCFNRIIGESAPMQAAYRVVQKVASTDATVLVLGPSGSGKELFARAIHVNSNRRAGPFVKVDCAALPASLIENELFGHEKGAFTGAEHRAAGKFETASGGTIFIDEIGELPLGVQGKLLRVIQDHEFDPVGATKSFRVDVRIVAATHRDLAEAVAKQQFREDLYYRIKVVELRLPALRERGTEDIERLARHFLRVFAQKHRPGGPPPKLSADALDRLKRYGWPGNVRELEHCVESAVVLCEEEIRAEDLSLPARVSPTGSNAEEPVTLAEAERRHILKTLARHAGNRSEAAKALGIGRNTLARKSREYGLSEA